MRRLLLALSLVTCATQALAAYLVEGAIRGNICTNYYLFQTCSFVQVDAVEGDNGRLFTVAERYETVTEHNANSSLCWIRLKYSDGWLSWIWRKTMGPQFFTKTKDGAYEKIEPEYLVFKCKKDD